MNNSNRNFVNLNINPCKMCMPMGAALAFKGIENSMFMLHGSQGCSTYIRRHMAGHFNEPVDIASSSLSEKGTVYGGESNLKKGLENMVKLYSPSIIGVSTTCLAETIGEDIKRIISEVISSGGFEGVRIIPVSTPGYGGTEYEGYFSAVTSLVKSVVRKSEPNGKINIIPGMLSPGDLRNLKAILNAFGIKYTMLPDISETLDAPYTKSYKRIAEGGTKISDIESMSGALATIEMALTIPEKLSPGQYLLEAFNVPLYKCGIPVGIENTDAFLELLSKLTGKKIPQDLVLERGRYLDGMIDSHKYNAEGRAVLYGNPELVLALGKLCFENGITPVLISTGGESTLLKSLLCDASSDTVVLDDIDFDTIRKYAVELKANLLIGNSDGKFITEKEGIPLIRAGFPIHDRMGGQRIVLTGFNGSMRLLDDITNTLLENKHRTYRNNAFQKFYKGDGVVEILDLNKPLKKDISIEERTKSHPCYNAGSCENARMHIPVAPLCNVSCNYCNRKFDCVNESRPGVTSEVLSPEEAVAKFIEVKRRVKNLKVIGIAGPGDALANFEDTKRSLQLIRDIDPDITFCLSTNGLMLPYYAEELIKLGVYHITITINAVDPKIGAKIYREVNFMGMKITGEGAARLLLMNQLAGLSLLTSRGVICKVNIVMIKGINDEHIEEVVKKVKECGAFITNIMPLIPAKGSKFEYMKLTNNKELNEMRKRCGIHVQQMYHCKQCRADAIGKLTDDISPEFAGTGCKGCSKPEKKEKEYIYTFAVASNTGKFIDRHFGQVEEFYLFNHGSEGIRFIEKRQVAKYCNGIEECDEESKIGKIIDTIKDCNAVIALRIGYNPKKKLEDKNIFVFETCGDIKEGIENAVSELMGKMLKTVG